MLIVKTKLQQSSIHGLGVFADEFIKSGTLIWEWHEDIDRTISIENVEKLPEVARDYIKKRFGWIENGVYNICLDHEQYVNHSETPNCIIINDKVYAKTDIQVGEELTQDYRNFDDKFGLKEFGYDW